MQASRSQGECTGTRVGETPLSELREDFLRHELAPMEGSSAMAATARRPPCAPDTQGLRTSGNLGFAPTLCRIELRIYFERG